MGATRALLDRTLKAGVLTPGYVSQDLNPSLYTVGTVNNPAVNIPAVGPTPHLVVVYGSSAGAAPTQRVVVYGGPTDLGPWIILYDSGVSDHSESIEETDCVATGPWFKSLITIAGGGGNSTYIAPLLSGGGAPTWDAANTSVYVFEDIVDRGLDTTMADVTVPAGNVGVAGPILGPLLTPSVLPSGSAVVDGTISTFRPNDASNAATLRGWYLATNEASPVLLVYGFFAVPVNLADETQCINLVCRPLTDAGANWIDVVVWG